MSYVVLARKYRPQEFESLIGQNPVSQTLVNALSTNRVAHAYVFSGPRGVGKTTTARILAKCLNCAKGTSITPCNECDSCISIAQGTSMQDVLEIDGASNRGIEQIRELRESAKYAPTSSRYRIYIIDEAHQITKDAFGALLKTLEEPPAHVVFMMATTEVQKIPAPILSRCQRFSLRPISSELVFNHLKDICKKEKVKIEDPALKDIVRFVEGSMRDALSLLDQALVFSPEGITSQTLRDLLGLLPAQVILEFASVIDQGDPVAILKNTNACIQNGIDLTQLAKDLQNHYHTLLLAKAGVQSDFSSPPTAPTDAAASSFEVLERRIRILSKALEEMRRSDTPRAVFEIHALKLGQKVLDAKALVERLEKLEQPEKQEKAPMTVPQPSFPRTRESSALPVVEKKVDDLDPGFRRDDVVQQKVENLDSRVRGNDGVSLDNWPQFVNDIAHQKQALASALDEASVAIQGSDITLTFNKTFNEQMVSRSMEMLKPFLISHFGASVQLLTKLDLKPSSPASSAAFSAPVMMATSAAPARAPEPETELEDVSPAEVGADIQKALKFFPGSLKKIKKSS